MSVIVKEKYQLTNQRYMFKDKERLLELSEEIVEIAIKASESVMDVYFRTEVTQEKKEDGPPVTEADLSSQRLILEGLNNLDLKFPVLSEEDKVNHKNEDIARP